MTIYMDERDWYYSDLDVGYYCVLVKSYNILTGILKYSLHPDEGGIRGNMNPAIKAYHGWRGTTNNITIEAKGLRLIMAKHICKNGSVRVWLSRDLLPDVP